MDPHIPAESAKGDEKMSSVRQTWQVQSDGWQRLLDTRHLSFSWNYIALVAISLLFCILTGTEAAAAGGGIGAQGIQFCAQLKAQAAAKNQFLGPLIHCFTDYPQGLIPSVTIQLLTNTLSYYMTAMQGLLTLMIVIFGYKVVTGDVQRLKGDGFTIAFKIAGVWYFMTNASNFYGDVMNIMNGLNTIIGESIAKFSTGTFCNNADIWAEFDCLFSWLTGVAAPKNAFSVVVGMLVLLFLLFVSAGTGVVILIGFLYLLVTAFFAVVRFIQIFVMSVLALSFMFLFGYLFVPFLFFKNTFHYFQKWLAICLSYILVPVIMYGYMGMMFIAMDQAVISGNTSIMHELFGDCNANPTSCVQLTAVHCPVNGGVNGTLCNSHHHNLMYLGPDDSVNQKIATNVGSAGQMSDNGISGTQYNSMHHSQRLDIGYDFLGGDITEMAFLQGKGKTDEQYLFDVVISVLVALLLAYIMLSLMSYIPDLAAELVSQGTSGARSVVKSQVFGEALVKQTLELAKEAALAYGSGGTSLARTAVKGLQQVASHSNS